MLHDVAATVMNSSSSQCSTPKCLFSHTTTLNSELSLSLSLSLRHSLLLKSLTRLLLKHTHTHTHKLTIAAKAQNTVKPETWQKFPLNAKDFSDNPSSSSSSSSCVCVCVFVCVRRAGASLVLWAASNCRNYAQGDFCALKMRTEHVRSCSSTVFVFQIWACSTTSSVLIQCKSLPKSSTLSTVNMCCAKFQFINFLTHNVQHFQLGVIPNPIQILTQIQHSLSSYICVLIPISDRNS